MFKVVSLLMNQSELIKLKDLILAERLNDNELEMELKPRKVTRYILLTSMAYTAMTAIGVLSFPLISSQSFAMPVYTQLPWTK